MGLKYYRGSDKPKRIRKRFTQTRTWIRQFSWACCKSMQIVKWSIWPTKFDFRSCASRICTGPRFQGRLSLLNRLSLEPWNEKVPNQHPLRILPTQPSQNCWISSSYCFCALFRFLLLILLRRYTKLSHGQSKVWKDAREHEEVLRNKCDW